MRHHTLVALAPGRAADFGFLNEMGALQVWGTAILFFDSILIILLYERSRGWFGDHVFPRLALAGALVSRSTRRRSSPGCTRSPAPVCRR